MRTSVIEKHWEKKTFVYGRDTKKYTILPFRNLVNSLAPGGRLNKKDGLTRYGDSHAKDKTS